MLDQVEQDLIVQRRQRGLQLEQSRYEARLAQRQYDAVDPANRLVAAELERRWNEKLERVAQLERAYAQAEREAGWTLTADERAAITGEETVIAHGDRIGAVGWGQRSRAGRSADSLALWHDTQSEGETG